MPDPFSNLADAPWAPATLCVAVAPHDSNALTDVPKALYVGGGGSVVLKSLRGGDVTFANVPAGSVLPVRASHVRATGTTATQIVALL